MTVHLDAGILSTAGRLLERAGIHENVRQLKLHNIGGNNRLYRVVAGSVSYAVKQYFRHNGDTRDRLGAEYAFLEYAHKLAPGRVPEPMAKDEASSFALYSFVEGKPFVADAIGRAEVDAAIAFFLAINPPGYRKPLATLPFASEASFAIGAHLDAIEGRIRQLQDAITQEPDSFAQKCIEELAQTWITVCAGVKARVGRLSLDMNAVLPLEQRCVSPSDFGFHNALRTSGGSICFLDFEYAGWDDPAKTAGDFFSQLAIPVSAKYFDIFIEGISRPFGNAEQLIERARLLRPVYQVKWCCIALNVFLPVHLARRKFANPQLIDSDIKRVQLAKAVKILETIQEGQHGLH